MSRSPIPAPVNKKKAKAPSSKSRIKKSMAMKPSSAKSASPKATAASKSSFQKKLSNPSASVSLSTFMTIYDTPITVQLRVDNGKISDAGFDSPSHAVLSRALEMIAQELVGKSPRDVETLSLLECMSALSPQSNLEREYIQYAYTAWMDVLSKVLLDDPLSKALGKLEKINKEFPEGTMVRDFGD